MSIVTAQDGRETAPQQASFTTIQADPAEEARRLQAALLNVTDPWDRSKLADDLAEQLTDLASTVRRIRTEAVRELIGRPDVKHQQVASHLGKSRQRISQWVDGGASRASVDKAEA